MHRISRTWTAIGATAAAAILTTAVAAQPAAADNGGHGRHGQDRAVVDRGTLVELNHSGVRGKVTLIERAGTLRVNLDVRGLEAGKLHVHHIHGFGNGTQAHCPDMSLAGADGVLSFAEGLPVYGPVLITLGKDVTPGSRLSYSRTFTSTDAGAPETSLGAYDQYVVVVHGITNAGTFEPTEPVACAVLTQHGHGHGHDGHGHGH